jgi:hypothetical protein
MRVHQQPASPITINTIWVVREQAECPLSPWPRYSLANEDIALAIGFSDAATDIIAGLTSPSSRLQEV